MNEELALVHTAFEVAELGSNAGNMVPGHQFFYFYSFTYYLSLTMFKT